MAMTSYPFSVRILFMVIAVHSTPHLLITVPLHSPIPSGSTHWVQARVFPQSTSYYSPVVSRVCLANPSSQTGERVCTKKCVSVCCTISCSKWFLRGGEGALRDGRDDLFCFPPFPLLTTSWRCLVNFLHWKGKNTPTPHFHIANSSSPQLHCPITTPAPTHHFLHSLQELSLLSRHLIILVCHFIIYLLNSTIYRLQHIILSTRQQLHLWWWLAPCVVNTTVTD